MANAVFYNPMHKIRQFHGSFRVKPFWAARSEMERSDVRLLRARLILEEAIEVIDALGFHIEDGHLVPTDGWTGDLKGYEHLAKELADLKVVTYGTDDVFEIPAERAFNEVMRSNMSKLGEDGNPVYRADGKVLKGPNYREADMHGVLTGEWM